MNIFLVTIFFFLLNQLTVSTSIDTNTLFDITSLGAKPDGKTDSTGALMAAWARACGSPRPAKILVPGGSFLVKRRAKFFGPCRNSGITLRIDGAIVAPFDYNVLGNAPFWLEFKNVNGVTISGGYLDGRGAGLWGCKAAGKKGCPDGITTLGFTNSNNILISGLTSLNSQLYHIVFNGCNNVRVTGVKTLAPGNSPNTDGIHVQLSSNVQILNTKLSTGDDCVSIGPGTSNLMIQDVVCGPGHGISIGSLAKDYEEQGVENVTVRGVTFSNTQNGVRIKSWGRPSKGFVRHILFQHATMVNVQNPIVIDQHYCPDNINCPGQHSGIQVNDVTYEGIHGSSATQVAVKFDCSKENPCTGITLKDVKLTFKSKPAKSMCANADGTTHGLIVPTSCL